MTKINRLEVAREQRLSRAWGVTVGGESSLVSEVDQVLIQDSKLYLGC